MFTNYRPPGLLPLANRGRGGGLGLGPTSTSPSVGTSLSPHRSLFSAGGGAGLGTRYGGVGSHIEQDSHAQQPEPPPPPPNVLIVGTTTAALQAWPVLYAAGFRVSAVVSTTAPVMTAHAEGERGDAGPSAAPPSAEEKKTRKLRNAAATKRVETFIKGCVELFQLPPAPPATVAAAGADTTVGAEASSLTSVARQAESAGSAAAKPAPTTPFLPLPTPVAPVSPLEATPTAPVTASTAATGKEHDGSAVMTAEAGGVGGSHPCRGIVAVPSVDALFIPPRTKKAGVLTTTKPITTAVASASITSAESAEGSSLLGAPDAAPEDAEEEMEPSFEAALEAADVVFIATADDFSFTPLPPPRPPVDTGVTAGSPGGGRNSLSGSATKPPFSVEAFMKTYSLPPSLQSKPSASSPTEATAATPTAAATAAKKARQLTNRDGFVSQCIERGKHIVFADGIAAEGTAALVKTMECSLVPPTTVAAANTTLPGGSALSAATGLGADGVKPKVLLTAAYGYGVEGERTERVKALIRAMGLPRLPPAPAPSQSPTAAVAAAAGAAAATTPAKPVSSAFTVSHASHGAAATASHLPLTPPAPPSLLSPPLGVAPPPSSQRNVEKDETVSEKTAAKSAAPVRRVGAVGRARHIDICLCHPCPVWDPHRGTGVGDDEDVRAGGVPDTFTFDDCVLPVQTARGSTSPVKLAMGSLLRRALCFLDALMEGRTPAAVQCRVLASAVDTKQDQTGTDGGASRPGLATRENDADPYVYLDDEVEKDAAERPAQVNGPAAATAIEVKLFFEIKYPAEESVNLTRETADEAASKTDTALPPPPPTTAVPPPLPTVAGGGIGVPVPPVVPPVLQPPQRPESQSESKEGSVVSDIVPVRLYLSVEPDAPLAAQRLVIGGTEGTIEMHDGILECCCCCSDGAAAAALEDDTGAASSRDVSQHASRCVVVDYVNSTSSTGARCRARRERVLFDFARGTGGAKPCGAPPARTAAGGAESPPDAAKEALEKHVASDEAAANALLSWKALKANLQYTTAPSGGGSSPLRPTPSYGSRLARGGRGGLSPFTGSRYRGAAYAAADEKERPGAATPGEGLKPHGHQRFTVNDSEKALSSMQRMLTLQLVQDKVMEAAGCGASGGVSQGHPT